MYSRFPRRLAYATIYAANFREYHKIWKRKEALYMKRKLLFTLVCALAVLLCAGTASAEESYAVGGGAIRVSAAGVVTSSDKSVTDVEIPAEVNGIAVTAIGNSAFKGRSQLTRVVIPDSVKTIGADAFNGAALTEIVMPAGAVLEEGAFSWCRYVNHITFTGDGDMADYTDTYTWSPQYAACYYNDHPLTIEIQSGVKSVGAHAFHSCGQLTQAKVADSVKTIGASAFEGCSKLAALPFVRYADSIGESAFRGCSGVAGAVVVKDGVTEIPAHAFHGCSMQTLTIPDSVKTIGVDAFNGAKLEEITMPAAAKLEEGAFSWCRYVNHITFTGQSAMADYSDTYTWSPQYAACYYNDHDLTVEIASGVKSVGAHAFHDCGRLTEANVADSVKAIGASAFQNCSKLNSIAFVRYADSVDEYAFYGCSGATGGAEIKDGVTQIPAHAFQGCSFQALTLPNSVATIGVDAFNGAKLEEITMPAAAKLEEGAFSWCRYVSHIVFTGDGDMADYTDTWQWSPQYAACYYNDHDLTVEIASGVTSVGAHAFHGCGRLTEANVADSVKAIGASAFQDCSSLADLSFVKYADTLGEYVFYNCSGSTGGVEVKDGVTEIPAHAFHGCSSLQTLTLPDSVKTVGVDAFNGCASMQTVTMPAAAVLLEGAFSWCRAVNDLTFTGKGAMADFTDSYTWSPQYSGCYYNDHDLNVKIQSGVTSVGPHAFHSCGRLLSADVADSVKTIGANAFQGCSKLNSIAFVRYADTIGESAFYGCSAATGNATVKDGVTSVAAHAFQGCAALQTLTLPESLETVGVDAFNGCAALASVTLPANVTLQEGAFSWCRGVSLVRFIGKADMSPFTDTYTWSPQYAGCYYNDHDVSVEIAPGVTGVGANALRGCGRVQKVTIPLSVTHIDANAFYDCSTLYVYYAGTEAQWGNVTKTLSKQNPNTLGNTNLIMNYGAASLLTVAAPDGRALLSESVALSPNALAFLIGYDANGKMTETQSRTVADDLAFVVSDPRTAKVRVAFLIVDTLAPSAAPLQAKLS